MRIWLDGTAMSVVYAVSFVNLLLQERGRTHRMYVYCSCTMHILAKKTHAAVLASGGLLQRQS